MDHPTPPDRSPPFPPRLTQFSLRSLLWLMTGVAVVCAVMFQMPDALAVPILMFVTMAMVPVLVTVIIHGSSYQRTFAIGAIFPPGLLLSAFTPLGGFFFGRAPMSMDPGESSGFRVAIGAFWISSLAMGLLCVGTRWLLERQRA